MRLLRTCSRCACRRIAISPRSAARAAGFSPAYCVRYPPHSAHGGSWMWCSTRPCWTYLSFQFSCGVCNNVFRTFVFKRNAEDVSKFGWSISLGFFFFQSLCSCYFCVLRHGGSTTRAKIILPGCSVGSGPPSIFHMWPFGGRFCDFSWGTYPIWREGLVAIIVSIIVNDALFQSFQICLCTGTARCYVMTVNESALYSSEIVLLLHGLALGSLRCRNKQVFWDGVSSHHRWADEGVFLCVKTKSLHRFPDNNFIVISPIPCSINWKIITDLSKYQIISHGIRSHIKKNA